MILAQLALPLLPLLPDSFSVGIVGDSQGNNFNVFGQHCQAMAREGISLFIGLGDHVQNGGAAEWQSQWTLPLTPISNIPRFACLGNHDPIQEFTQHVWQIPQHPLTSIYGNAIGCWGAVTVGSVRLAFLDTNESPAIRLSLGAGGSQAAWLLAETASPDWQTAGKRIAVFHHPLITEYWDGGCLYPGLAERRWLMDTLAARGCSLSLSGHAHTYSRGEWRGMPFIISGGGGGWLDTTHCWDWPEITVAQATWHWLKMQVDPTALTITARNTQGQVIDTVRIP